MAKAPTLAATKTQLHLLGAEVCLPVARHTEHQIALTATASASHGAELPSQPKPVVSNRNMGTPIGGDPSNRIQIGTHLACSYSPHRKFKIDNNYPAQVHTSSLAKTCVAKQARKTSSVRLICNKRVSATKECRHFANYPCYATNSFWFELKNSVKTGTPPCSRRGIPCKDFHVGHLLHQTRATGSSLFSAVVTPSS